MPYSVYSIGSIKKDTKMVKSNIKTIAGRFGTEAIANHLGVSVQTINTYIRRGYVSPKRIMLLGKFDPQFTHSAFVKDLRDNKIDHITKGLYHASN